MAPDAPMLGTFDPLLKTICASPAASPHTV